MNNTAAKITPNSPCPCTSGKDFASCCGQYIGTKIHAPTAEALMRTRYSAYVLCDIEHLMKTIPLLHRKAFDQKAAESWSQHAEWLGLEVLSSKEYEQGKKARVEFKAKYKIENEEQNHHEIAIFEKVQGRWFFVDSKMIEK